MIEPENDIELPVVGKSVSRLTIDFDFTLLFEEGGSLVLGTEFELTEPFGGKALLDPESDRALLAPALRLFGQSIAGAVATSKGSLLIEFQNGSKLTVRPDQKYEAWTVTTDAGMWVATPGGGLSSWGPFGRVGTEPTLPES